MVRLGIIISLIALIGVILSGLAASRVYDQELTINRIALSRAVDIHASIVQDRLTERELLARVASGLFRNPSVIKTNMLEPLRASIYAFKSDFVLVSWIARLQPAELPTAVAGLKMAGFNVPGVHDFSGKAVDIATIDKPIDVLMDMEPRAPATEVFAGRIIDRSPVLGPMLRRAMNEGRPVASDPFPLLGEGGDIGVVIAAPVLQEGNALPVGFVSFSYRLGTLMLTNDELSLFAVALTDPRKPGQELIANDDGLVTVRNEVADAPPSIRRVVSFGGRDWLLEYYAKTDLQNRAWRLAMIVIGIGMGVTAIVGSLFGYAGYNNVRLSREIETRIGFEQRLTAVIDELNHRVKNVLAVIQSIATRTLRSGSDMVTAREMLIGRIHAMSHVVSLLSESQWQGVNMRGLFEARALPHAERIAVSGPELVVSARAAQSLSLLFFELASHSDEGLSLVGKPPNITAHWQVVGEGPGARFEFRWEEFNTSETTRRPDTEFGVVLLDRVAPEALGGIATRYFTEASYVYELVAPLETVLDMTERDRTEALAMPARTEG